MAKTNSLENNVYYLIEEKSLLKSLLLDGIEWNLDGIGMESFVNKIPILSTTEKW